jgi:hypothetical protein
MTLRAVATGLALALLANACKPPVQVTPAAAGASAAEIALTGASVLIGVGDIASCDSEGDEQTARLVDSVLKADSVAGVSDAVFTLGDNTYPDGAASEFAICFTPSWGDSAKRIMAKIHPSVGNHEHLSERAAPYYQYFGSKAGPDKRGYYSYDLGEWHIIVLNSEIIVNSSFTAAERKAQEDWLRAEFEGPQKVCTLAYWHHARFSSGWHRGESRLQPIWQILADGGASVILSGHDHHYERFLPQSPAGIADSVNGMVQYVVGTGGGELRGFSGRPAPNSAAQVEGHFGVLKLSLGKGEYSSAFLDAGGRVYDSHSGKCRAAADPPPIE